MHCYLQFILRTHYNPPTEVLHVLSGILPMALMLTKERLQIARALANTCQLGILRYISKSQLISLLKADLGKLYLAQ